MTQALLNAVSDIDEKISLGILLATQDGAEVRCFEEVESTVPDNKNHKALFVLFRR